MEDIFRYYVIAVGGIVAAAALLRAASALVRALRRGRHAGLVGECIRLTAAAAVDETLIAAATACARKIPPRRLAESLVMLTDNLCGEQTQARVGAVARGAGLYDAMLRRARRRRGLARACLLSLLAKLPSDAEVARRTRRFLDDRNGSVRFYALMIQLAADGTSAVRRIGEFDRRLSHFEVAEMMTLLRRGRCPIAYSPLLRSGNRNLTLLGMHIVRQYGITDCEDALHGIAACGDDDLCIDAVRIIATLRGSASSPGVRDCIRRLPPARRRSIYRHFALEGYSASSLGALFAARTERRYFESVLNTYKRRIACQYV